MAPRASPTIRLDVTITSLAPGGHGVAHVEMAGERRAVFVAHAAPGDVLSTQVDVSRRPARGDLLRVLVPGPDRVTPACPWSTRCGGCDWMHLSLEAQARAHIEHVRAALPAEWRGAAIDSHCAPAAVAYRSRARVHVTSERGTPSVGMHASRTHLPVDVEACAVLAPGLENARRMVARLVEGSRGRGDVQLALGVDRLPVFDFRWAGDFAAACFARLDQAVARRQIAGARVTSEGASRPAVVGDPTPWLEGADGLPLRGVSGGFAQASDLTSAMLARHVAELVRPWHADKAVELYAGAGNFSVLLAREVGELVMVESNREACEAARMNLAARGIEGRVVEADGDSFVWSPMTRLAVIDPPRDGARAAALRLASSRVAHVVYVSCDTQTLQRDLQILAPAYELRSVATFEMFPQTSHIETVVALERRRGKRP